MYVAYVRDFSQDYLKLRAAFESTLPNAKNGPTLSHYSIKVRILNGPNNDFLHAFLKIALQSASFL